MKAKLLLIDDDPTLLRFLGEFLENNDFTVTVSPNGQDGLRAAYRDHPDLVLLDVMMPGMDGWQVCARLRELSDVPIILITGKSTETDKLRGFKLGVDDYVTKPFSFAELTARVQAVLGRARLQTAPGQNNLKVGDITIEVDKHLARRGDEIIPLTPTEFRLLEYLARRKGTAVPEEELVQAVWGEYRSEDTTTVRRYIWLLRQKIEPDPANPRWILTIRGFGYRMGTGPLHEPKKK